MLLFRYGLLGPSGIGKTTLLNCIIGTTDIDSGEISVFGNKARCRDRLRINSANLGYMPQVNE